MFDHFRHHAWKGNIETSEDNHELFEKNFPQTDFQSWENLVIKNWFIIIVFFSGDGWLQRWHCLLLYDKFELNVELRNIKS